MFKSFKNFLLRIWILDIQQTIKEKVRKSEFDVSAGL